jgi:thymidine kinase
MAKLHFYYSAMNAGKTTTLLQSSYNYQERGMETLLFLPAFDDRAGQGKISSRIGLYASAVTFDGDFCFFSFLQESLEKNPNIRCVLVDEAQFLTRDQVFQLCDVADILGVPVLAYGLRSDFRGEPFEGSQYLLSLAEEISEIKTICQCGRKATMNARIDDLGRVVPDGEQIEIGGNERYVAMCRKHFLEAIKNARKGDTLNIRKGRTL